MFHIILALDSGMGLDSEEDKYDRNLIHSIRQITDNRVKFYSVCPAANKALEKYYALDDMTLYSIYQEWFLKLTLEEIMGTVLGYILSQQEAFTNSMRDRAFEKFIIDRLAKPRKTLFKITYYQQNLSNGNQKHVSISEVIYFSGDELEKNLLNTIRLAGVSKQTLFVPYSSSYGLITCLLLDHVLTKDPSSKTVHQITLYLLQITTNVNGHSKGDITFHEDISKKKKCGHNICNVIPFSS